MANFPFKNATFTKCASGMSYMVLRYGAVYYTKIDGVITAIKPIAQGIYRDMTVNSWTWILKVLAANGKEYDLDMCGRKLFLSADDAIAYEKNTSSMYRSEIPQKRIGDLLERDYGHVLFYGNAVQMYVWYSGGGYAGAVEGGYIFWADQDGEHIELQKMHKDTQKLYLTKEECVLDNLKVVEFAEDVPVPQGEYTVKREFTVKATSEEEAESIIDEVINKAYKEQFK